MRCLRSDQYVIIRDIKISDLSTTLIKGGIAIHAWAARSYKETRTKFSHNKASHLAKNSSLSAIRTQHQRLFGLSLYHLKGELIGNSAQEHYI